MATDTQLAQRIAEATSVLSFDDALAALKAGGRLRQLAINLLEADERFEAQRKRMAAATEELRRLTAA